MPELTKIKPKSRDEWRAWLDKNHGASQGVWLVFAKKHTGLATVSYDEAVQEALCFGWIDSLMRSIDDRFHMQMFTPRKAKSAWSVTNKARLAKLMKAGMMAPAGLAAVAQAKKSGSWNAYAHVDAMTIPPELKKALDANPDAKKNWPTYSESAQKSFLHMVSGAKRPETREKRVARVIDLVSNKVSMTEIRREAMGGKKVEPPRPRASR